MLWCGGSSPPRCPFTEKEVLCCIFPRATRPACLAPVSCFILSVFCETGHILSCYGGASGLCSHADCRFELCISSYALGDAGSCVSPATIIRVLLLHSHAAIFVGVSTAGTCSSSCHKRTASQRGLRRRVFFSCSQYTSRLIGAVFSCWCLCTSLLRPALRYLHLRPLRRRLYSR